MRIALSRLSVLSAFLLLVSSGAGRAEKPAGDVLVEIVEAPLQPPGPAALTVRLRTDGRYEGRKSGKLSRAGLAKVKDLVNKAKLVMKRGFNPCDALEMGSITLRTQKGELTWTAPCAPEPDPSVAALVNELYKLTRATE